ncbi:MAG: hypothetical protein JSR82_15140 [Verrucomicrobia bacterium]|nr:hypothetical protein [Verrucomicrobiota bacterium]
MRCRSFLFAALLAVLPLASAQTFERRDLISFGQRDPQGGTNPEDPLILGRDGLLYGVTRSGGTFSQGVVYRLNPADNAYLVLRQFTGGADDGGKPMGTALCHLDDGRLYGLALNPQLILWSMQTDGSDFRKHFTFPPGAETGGPFHLTNSLSPGADGLLYGVYHVGPSTSPEAQSNIFRIARDGSGFQALGQLTNITSPISFDATGRLFGTTESTVFRLQPDGSGFVTLFDFPPPAFSNVLAEGGVTLHSNGSLYGFTARGGVSGRGMFYRLRPDGSDFQIMFEPPVNTESGHLRAPCFESDDGFIYGCVGEDGFGTQSFIWRIRPDGTGWQVLKRLNFNIRGTNGVVQAPNGMLYGYTTANPDDNCLFRIGRDGSGYEIIHRFPSLDGFPLSPITLVRGADQRLYGLTDSNGANGRGTLFRVSPDGSNLTVLREFGAGPAAEQGSGPRALAASADGSIYGVVRQVGSVGGGIFRYEIASGQFSWIQQQPAGQLADNAGILHSASDGLVYAALDTASAKTERLVRLHPSGTGFTVLRTQTSTAASFAGTGALTEGPDGLLYGITMRNGASTLPLLFRLTRDGSAFTPLTDINAGTFSAATPRGLLVTPAGQIFGFASTALWRCQTDGTGFTVLRNYPSTVFGETPLLGFDGRIYVSLRFSGASSSGGLARFLPDGTGYEDIVAFPTSTEPLRGRFPVASPVVGPDGAFYGLTAGGGFANRGTLYRVASPAQIVGLASFGFNDRGRFTGSVSGPAGRPVDVWRSDDLMQWSLLQRIAAPETNASFTDPDTQTGRRFYRATAP